jgi:hypothetical protein
LSLWLKSWGSAKSAERGSALVHGELSTPTRRR